MATPDNDKKYTKDTTKINENIRAREVRVIDEAGEMVGVLSLREALDKAKEEGLDLVEVNPEVNPPVCKILDYGKHKYTLQKKKKEAKKKQRIIILKELYLHIGIGEHDYNVKLKQLKKFLDDECKVKVAVKLRGREMAYSAKALELLNKFYEDIGKAEVARLETSPRMEGNNAVTVFSPLSIK